jgi:diguanylate cyclase (GGDEF)-like protein
MSQRRHSIAHRWCRYSTWRRVNPLTWRQVGWYFGGSWALIAVGVLDTQLPAAAARDLLYLVPLGFATWRLGRQGAWLLALNASTVNLLAAGERLGSSRPVAVELSMGASVLQFGLFTYGVLLLRDALGRERQRANEDALTGLLNRRAFTDVLTGAITGERRRRRPGQGSGALAYVDLDGFKAVNDTRGHDAGDAVLQLAAGVLRSAVRDGDVVARLGGDEFALWLPSATAEEARAVGARVLERLRSGALAEGWAVGASIGVALFPTRPESAAAALAAADALMYEVKRSGKGRVHVALQPAA